jgi:hypothetical protein
MTDDCNFVGIDLVWVGLIGFPQDDFGVWGGASLMDGDDFVTFTDEGCEGAGEFATGLGGGCVVLGGFHACQERAGIEDHGCGNEERAAATE